MMTQGTLYLNGQAIGTCQVTTLPDPPRPAPLTFSDTLTFSGTFRLAGKKARRLRQAVHELAMGRQDKADVRHYRRVKHHQLRKRRLKQ